MLTMLGNGCNMYMWTHNVGKERRDFMPTSEVIGKRLKKLRGRKSQRSVAKDLNIAPSTYAMYEVGQRIPRDETKQRIATYYKKSVQSIFFDS